MVLAIPIQTVPVYGGEIDDVQWTAADQDEDHEYTNDGSTILLVRNTEAAARTVTIVSVPDRLNRTGNLSVVVPAGDIGFVGPLPTEGFNAPDGNVDVTLTDESGLSFAAIRLPRR